MGVTSPAAGVIGSCEPSDLGAGSWPRVLCKSSSSSSEPQSHLSSPQDEMWCEKFVDVISDPDRTVLVMCAPWSQLSEFSGFFTYTMNLCASVCIPPATENPAFAPALCLCRASWAAPAGSLACSRSFLECVSTALHKWTAFACVGIQTSSKPLQTPDSLEFEFHPCNLPAVCPITV